MMAAIKERSMLGVASEKDAACNCKVLPTSYANGIVEKQDNKVPTRSSKICPGRGGGVAINHAVNSLMMKLRIATTKNHETIWNSYETMMAQHHKLWNQTSKPQWVQAGAAARCNPWYVRNPRPPKRHTSGQVGLSMSTGAISTLSKWKLPQTVYIFVVSPQKMFLHKTIVDYTWLLMSFVIQEPWLHTSKSLKYWSKFILLPNDSKSCHSQEDKIWRTIRLSVTPFKASLAQALLQSGITHACTHARRSQLSCHNSTQAASLILDKVLSRQVFAESIKISLIIQQQGVPFPTGYVFYCLAAKVSSLSTSPDVAHGATSRALGPSSPPSLSCAQQSMTTQKLRMTSGCLIPLSNIWYPTLIYWFLLHHFWRTNLQHAYLSW